MAPIPNECNLYNIQQRHESNVAVLICRELVDKLQNSCETTTCTSQHWTKASVNKPAGPISIAAINRANDVHKPRKQ